MKAFNFILNFILFQICISLIPQWNLEELGKDLLSSSQSYEYIIHHKYFESKELKMTKRLSKSNNNIIYSNILSIERKNREVPFDFIESSYELFGTYIICPLGKYHPYDFINGEYIIPDSFDETDNWDLKCYLHQNSGYLIVSYLTKKGYNFFYTSIEKIEWGRFLLAEKIFDYKINNTIYKEHFGEYPMIQYCIKDGNLFIKKDRLILKKDKIDTNTLEYCNILNELMAKSKGFFKDNSNNFYLITYDANNFLSGYTNKTFDDNFEIQDVNMSINSKLSFEFMDEVEIKEINFILRNKFVYYILKNRNNDKYYHGIIDIELNKVIFNTDETINSFIPYSDNSMLAITPKTAYRICVYNEGDNCVDYCEDGYLLDTSGNKCGTSCPSGKFQLIPNDVCIDTCNTSFYVISNQKCGLCKDIYPSNPYKFINSTNCLSSIPEGAEIYNENLYLLKCKEGYHFKEDSCEKDIICYETCEECSEESFDEYNQKCTKCKSDYLFEKGNCLAHCSNGYEKIGNECHSCDNKDCVNFYINLCDCFECKEHYYLKENICLECNSNCKECFNNEDNCTSCDENSFLFNNQCLECTECKDKDSNSCKCLSCNEGYYLENHQCKKCGNNCKECINNNKCNSCYDGYILNNKICVQCHDNCELCFAPSNGDTKQNCLSCKDNNTFLYDYNCLDNCSDGLYEYNKECKKCNGHCKTCEKGEETNNENCLSCDVNSEYKYLIDANGFGKNCVKECPSGTILKESKCISKTSEEEEEISTYSIIIISSSIFVGIIIIVIILMCCCGKNKPKFLKDKEADKIIKEINSDLGLYKSFE